MENNNQRYLKTHYPFLENNPDLPLGLSYTQLYTGVVLNETGIAVDPDMPERIHVEKYQIAEIELYPVFHKPISKFLEIDEEA